MYRKCRAGDGVHPVKGLHEILAEFNPKTHVKVEERMDSTIGLWHLQGVHSTRAWT